MLVDSLASRISSDAACRTACKQEAMEPKSSSPARTLAVFGIVLLIGGRVANHNLGTRSVGRELQNRDAPSRDW
jgi:hypothetical protein